MCIISTRTSVVDVQPIPLNCLESNSPSIISSTQLIIIDSNTFAAIGVSDAGLMFFFQSTWMGLFSATVLRLHLPFLRNCAFASELLKIAVNGGARLSA